MSRKGSSHPWLKGDFHMHTHASPDSTTTPQQLVRRCLEVGLDIIAVTDHNTIRGALEVQRIAPFPVIIGEEARTTHGEITGLFLQEEIPKGLSPLEAARRIKEQGGLVSLPHPFDRFRPSRWDGKLLEELLPLVDLVEAFNARTLLRADIEKSWGFAQARGIPALGVSDAHHPAELGRTYTELPPFDGTPQGFKEAVARGRIIPHRTPWSLRFLSLFARLKKWRLS